MFRSWKNFFIRCAEVIVESALVSAIVIIASKIILRSVTIIKEEPVVS